MANVYDDSLWVLWRKYIKNTETNEKLLAKNHFPAPYAIFPGTPSEQGEREPIIYARIADNWGSLRADTCLRFDKVLRAVGNQEPILVLARRTAEGGIRRTNDFRPMQQRPRWADS